VQLNGCFLFPCGIDTRGAKRGAHLGQTAHDGIKHFEPLKSRAVFPRGCPTPAALRGRTYDAPRRGTARAPVTKNAGSGQCSRPNVPGGPQAAQRSGPPFGPSLRASAAILVTGTVFARSLAPTVPLTESRSLRATLHLRPACRTRPHDCTPRAPVPPRPALWSVECRPWSRPPGV